LIRYLQGTLRQQPSADPAFTPGGWLSRKKFDEIVERKAKCRLHRILLKEPVVGII
jgi:hypothetical protein